jgi:AbrB family looped-hinge helix DNA binding protein
MFHHHFEKKSVGTTVVGERGQVVIPVEVRERLNLKKGDELLVFARHDKFIGLVKADEIDQVLDKITKKFTSAISKIRQNMKEE